MTVKFQFRVLPDGEWATGAVKFDGPYAHVEDHLRFHRGEGFHVGDGDGTWGPKRTLRQLKRPFEKRVKDAKLEDAVFVRSAKDGFTIAMRRVEDISPVADQMRSWAEKQIGEGYLLDSAGPNLWDCSGFTMVNTQIHTGVRLFHNATVQMHDPRVHSIKLAQAKPMDMVFLHGSWFGVDHVAYVYDRNGPGGSIRVIDAEPHDTGSPSGWFKEPNLGTGIQIRPMIPGYYCGPENIVKVGRLYAVNGRP